MTSSRFLYCGCHVLAGIVVLVAFLSVYPIRKLRSHSFMIATFFAEMFGVGGVLFPLYYNTQFGSIANPFLRLKFFELCVS